MDPDHPLAALVRKARQEQNGAAAAAASAMATKPEEGPAEPAVPATPAEYTADREYSFSSMRVKLGNCEIQYLRRFHIGSEGASSSQFSPGPLHFSSHFLFHFPFDKSSVSDRQSATQLSSIDHGTPGGENNGPLVRIIFV